MVKSTTPHKIADLASSIDSPTNLRDLSYPKLADLADGEFLARLVSCTGGHLGSNLGVVELTLALHRVFDSPIDRIIWDTGHQSYVHKIITGRQDRFASLRKKHGLSGYPNRIESPHDFVENSHASTALCYADGLAKADRLRGARDHVVVVIGDGALTGGMAWEALNNIAVPGQRIVIVLNDNGRSYSPTVGGLATHLAELRSELPQSMFSNLGLDYLGPIDGHDTPALESTLADAKTASGPVLVHCVTVKGRGYPPAENDPVDRCHVIKPATPATASRSWTSVFSEELVRIGEQREDVVGVTAAMMHPVGLAALLDCALHGCGVTFVLDRAGVTGDDGPSHNGMWDLSILQVVPALRMAAPRDEGTLRAELHEAVKIEYAPSAIRFPKGPVLESIPVIESVRGVDVLHGMAGSPGGDVLLIAVGPMANVCLSAAQQLEIEGIAVTVVDPRWVLPVNPALVTLVKQHRLAVSVEDNLRVGGVGAAIAQSLRDARVHVPFLNLGIEHRFLAQASRAELLAEMGLTQEGILRQVHNNLPAEVRLIRNVSVC